MTTQPTPGPWTVRRDVLDRDSFDVIAPNEDAGKQGVSYAGDYFMVAHSLDSEADARLIAAAPRMLEALGEALMEHKPCDVLDCWCRNATHAYNDARGV